jgi:hypothetical protein
MGMRMRGEDAGGPSEEPQDAPEEEPTVGEKRERSPTPLSEPEVADIEGPVEMTNQPPLGIPRPMAVRLTLPPYEPASPPRIFGAPPPAHD